MLTSPTTSDAHPHGDTRDDSSNDRYVDVLCFSHLRWHFVTQRPQHLLSRCARARRVFFWEEPYFDADDNGNGTPTLERIDGGDGVLVLRPHLPRSGDAADMQRALLNQFVSDWSIKTLVRWYYTPMALAFSAHLNAAVTVYDCMDELTGFAGAPPELGEREAQLLRVADLVFTGGKSLYEAKRQQHAKVFAFPSSIDRKHFSQASQPMPDPSDQRDISHPRAGFFGVLDERFDAALMGDVARARPLIQFVFIGPIVKINPDSLPIGPNIHYLSSKGYADLPAYLANWEAALIPFALNDSTRYISPTKTPEYLAALKPVVSTPIHDVITDYGDSGLVAIAPDAESFALALDAALQPASPSWKLAVSKKLEQSSWDSTWQSMWQLVEEAMYEPYAQQEADSKQVAFRVPLTQAKLRSVRQESFDYLVVGAGFAGAVLAERLANEAGKRVLIIDKRDHIAGNAYDFHDEAGLLVHRYGPHIFHTNSVEVFDYLSQFTQWRSYEHRVLASVDQTLVPIPINLTTINTLFDLQLDQQGMKDFLAKRVVLANNIRTSEDIVKSRVGTELYQKFFQNYTRKQWGLDPSELDASVAGRIPVRLDCDDRYFTDNYQCMPKNGFTHMFHRMLDSKLISVQVGTSYKEVVSMYPGIQTIFTGPVDEFFNYKFGPLPYRSLHFRHETVNVERFQPAAVINYPNDHAYTRVTEFKYLTGQSHPKTSIVYEYPTATGDPYYPIPRAENAAVYAKYKSLADRMSDVYFVGRLATYRYYNMDQVVAQALTTFRKIHNQSSSTEPLQADVSHLVPVG